VTTNDAGPISEGAARRGARSRRATLFSGDEKIERAPAHRPDALDLEEGGSMLSSGSISLV